MPNDNDLNHLHPDFAVRVEQLLDYAHRQKNMPIELFEGYRTPERQAMLYAKGRVAGIGTPGRYVTFERAWQSNHQHGMAGDFVWFFDGKWSWDPPKGFTWEDLYSIADQVQLEHLDFEKPHLQLRGFKARAILNGTAKYPDWHNGGIDWAENLDANIVRWGEQPHVIQGVLHPGAPPMLQDERPAIVLPDGIVHDARTGQYVLSSESA